MVSQAQGSGVILCGEGAPSYLGVPQSWGWQGEGSQKRSQFGESPEINFLYVSALTIHPEAPQLILATLFTYC